MLSGLYKVPRYDSILQEIQNTPAISSKYLAIKAYPELDLG